MVYCGRLGLRRWEETLRSFKLVLIATSVLLLGSNSDSIGQIRVGPDGVEVGPRDRPPPPREFERREPVRDELRERLFRLREECEDGNRRACVRYGIIIGENRGRREEWRRERPDLFFYER